MSPAGSHNLVGAVSIGQAMLVAWLHLQPIGPFLERAVGEIGPPAWRKGWVFHFFFIDLSFLLFRRGLDSLALILPLIGSLACVDLVGF